VAVRRILEVVTVTFGGALGKRLLRIPRGKAPQPLELGRLVELDAGKGRSETAARKGFGDFAARRQRRVEVARREKTSAYPLR
jgi:hypothetical protein